MNQQDFVSPLDDFYFRLVFANPLVTSPLTNFIRALFPDHCQFMKDLVIIDPSQNLGHKPVKTGLVSVLITSELEITHNVEIVVTSNPLERVEAQLYVEDRQANRMFQGELDKSKIDYVTTILISGYPLTLGAPNFAKRVDFDLADSLDGELLATGSLWTYELPNLPLTLENYNLWAWLRFLGARNELELLAAADLSPEIDEAYRIFRSLVADDRSRHYYNVWRAEMDQIMNEVYQSKSPAELWPESSKLLATFGQADKWSTILH
ncbi:MAG: Rpn family recombination-promoting nuclease/putative transposase [Deltaproteobacteria bacterium]|jgi:hypothetical protein|nr:Rpn family recombination-promoting nuclease/putative transposase [Deltaproteobacteria bacterium]